jgi:hypothetical protein
MQRKIEDLDIPKDDIECWERYPKHRWVYDNMRLLDVQNVKWSPYESSLCKIRVAGMDLFSEKGLAYSPAYIYVEKYDGQHILASAYMSKGDIGLIRYFDKSTNTELAESIGNVELRITSFVTMHFPKFTGIVSAELIGTHIVSVMLRLNPELALIANTESAKLLKRIYKKNDVVHINGLTDQIHHKSLIS